MLELIVQFILGFTAVTTAVTVISVMLTRGLRPPPPRLRADLPVAAQEAKKQYARFQIEGHYVHTDRRAELAFDAHSAAEAAERAELQGVVIERLERRPADFEEPVAPLWINDRP